MAHLVGGPVHPSKDHLLGVLRTGVQPPLQVSRRRRQYEYADDIGPRLLAQLLRALPVDVEQHVLSRR